MAFPRFLLKSVGSKWGEHVKRDRASPVCLGADRLVRVCGRGRYVYTCMCLLPACSAARAGARGRAVRVQGCVRPPRGCVRPRAGEGKALGDVSHGWSSAAVPQPTRAYIPNGSEREDIYGVAEILNSLTGLWIFSSSLFEKLFSLYF